MKVHASIKNKIKSEIFDRTRKKYDNTQPEDYKKVMHIWDTAGVASLLSRELNKNGYQSDVLMRSEHDPYGMTEYYKQQSLDLGGSAFLSHCKRKAEDYGIIHIHGIPELIPEYKKAFPNKKIILQFHGSDITDCKDIDTLVNNSKHADAIICSTADLEQYVLKHPELPKPYVCVNPVDTDLFKPIATIPKSDKAVYIKIRYLDFPAVENYLKENCDWDIEYFDRENNGVSFYFMPEFYNKYSKFVDVKIYPHLNGVPGQAMSKSGLEALACGLEVLNYKGEIVKGLPEEHTLKYQTEMLIQIYETLVDKKKTNI